MCARRLDEAHVQRDHVALLEEFFLARGDAQPRAERPRARPPGPNHDLHPERLAVARHRAGDAPVAVDAERLPRRVVPTPVCHVPALSAATCCGSCRTAARISAQVSTTSRPHRTASGSWSATPPSAPPHQLQVDHRRRRVAGRRHPGRRVQARGLDPTTAPMYAQMLVGMVGTVGQWWLDTRKPEKRVVATHVVNLAWNGLSGLEQKPRLSQS